MMRVCHFMIAVIATMGATMGSVACTKAEDAGAEAAKREAEEELKKKAAETTTAKKVNPPVAGRANIPCEQLIDTAGFTTALGEKEPVSVKDATKSDAEATASCAVVRGGKRPSAKEQEAMLKKSRRLGVLSGDEICNVTAYCWIVEEDAHFRRRCKEMGNRDDDSLGSYACVQVVAQGADDVNVYQLLDEDTKCVIKVRGGPSMVDNQIISSCAKAARDLIGPANIQVGGAPAAPAAAAPEPAAGDKAEEKAPPATEEKAEEKPAKKKKEKADPGPPAKGEGW